MATAVLVGLCALPLVAGGGRLLDSHQSSVTNGALPLTGVAPTGVAPTATDAPVGVRSSDPLAILTALDRRRSEAYARRQPSLLEQVYSSPTLRVQDSARLASTVPAGCQLAGLSTSYRQLQVESSGLQIRLRVTAAVAGGQLRCPGRPVSYLAEAAPVRLAIVLADTGAGYLIWQEGRA